MTAKKKVEAKDALKKAYTDKNGRVRQNYGDRSFA